MDLKSSDHQLGLVVYPIIFRVLHIPGGWPWNFWTINSITHDGFPWDDCGIFDLPMYLNGESLFGKLVGKYTSPMDPMD